MTFPLSYLYVHIYKVGNGIEVLQLFLVYRLRKVLGPSFTETASSKGQIFDLYNIWKHLLAHRKKKIRSKVNPQQIDALLKRIPQIWKYYYQILFKSQFLYRGVILELISTNWACKNQKIVPLYSVEIEYKGVVIILIMLGMNLEIDVCTRILY